MTEQQRTEAQWLIARLGESELLVYGGDGAGRVFSNQVRVHMNVVSRAEELLKALLEQPPTITPQEVGAAVLRRMRADELARDVRDAVDVARSGGVAVTNRCSCGKLIGYGPMGRRCERCEKDGDT